MPRTTLFPILAAISFCHMLNDMMQSLLLAIYPLLKESFALDFAQIGLITLTFQLTASILQPVVGMYTDRYPKPYSLVAGMACTLSGLLLLATAAHFALVLLAAALIGFGSSIFHPESSRVARLASGGRHGLAQSFFQVGGNFGTSLGPLLAAFVVLPHGRASIAWFGIAALIAMLVLGRVGAWYSAHLREARSKPKSAPETHWLTRRQVGWSVAILLILIFSKFFYMASLTSYYTFYLIHTFGISVKSAQLHLFLFLGAVALGTFAGGPLGDRFGRKYVIWFSIVGALPFTLMMPYANLFWTGVLSVVIGLVLSSAFAAILVYAQELIPGRIGMISGLFYGFAFGMAGIGAALLGALADATSIGFVYHVCAFLPVMGLLTAFLPHARTPDKQACMAPLIVK